jgi:DNA primase
MFWQLTARGENPRRLVVPAGYDPAELLQHESVAALRTAIDGAGPLAHHLLDARITRARSSPEGIAEGVRGIAAVIAAMPPAQRLAAIDRATRALQLPIGAVHTAVLTATPGAAERRPSPRPLATTVSRPPTADLPRAPGTGTPAVRTSTPTSPDR